jgi:hypothetical protein
MLNMVMAAQNLFISKGEVKRASGEVIYINKNKNTAVLYAHAIFVYGRW